jgi:hypothetical protein
VDPTPNRRVLQANYKLLELCGSVLLPAALQMSAARFVAALINALLYGVSDVFATVETSMRDPRGRDRDDEDHGGHREGDRRAEERDRPTGAEQRERRDDPRGDGSRQRDTEHHQGRRHDGGDNKQAVGGSAGLTIKTPPTICSWPRVRLFLQMTRAGWTLTICVFPWDIPKALRSTFPKADKA